MEETLNSTVPVGAPPTVYLRSLKPIYRFWISM
jgi:hypothetical protein